MTDLLGTKVLIGDFVAIPERVTRNESELRLGIYAGDGVVYSDDGRRVEVHEKGVVIVSSVRVDEVTIRRLRRYLVGAN